MRVPSLPRTWIRTRTNCVTALLVAASAFAVLPRSTVLADDDTLARETRADQAVDKYGITGKGVVIAILDRGVDWRHPDFINPEGTTRIKWLLDMSGQNRCDPSNPAPLEYSEQQINAALAGGPPIHSQDAVGHGTVTAGVAAGNGRATADRKYAGMAPDADLIIV